jgi:hypothetical protein
MSNLQRRVTQEAVPRSERAAPVEAPQGNLVDPRFSSTIERIQS